MIEEQKIPQSWGHYPKVEPAITTPLYWRHPVPDLADVHRSILPYAYGRSYGDSCLNADGISLDVSHLRRFISFDENEGVLRCEAGVSLADILEEFVPRGWFLPVSPGTKFVSVGGAIANDIHGKNHHRAGTFGRHVTRFELLRSNGERFVCSPTEHSDLFRATTGGLGLTGVILWAEIRLKRIVNSFLDTESIRYPSLKAFMEIAAESDKEYEYTVAWVDCLARGPHLGRGLFLRGNHNESAQLASKPASKKLSLTVPLDFPSFVLNTLSIKAFNEVYYRKQRHEVERAVERYEPFFYPLDAIHHWNRMYGKRGFLQYQCVVPFQDGYEVMRDILQRISRSGEGSFLTVLKMFGDLPSPGMLSFPRPGLTLALDFPNNGRRTSRLFDELDGVVRQSGGAVYPAKDAHMSPESFEAYYPQWHEFAQYIDPHFSSSFWRRVTATSRTERTSENNVVTV